MFCLWPAGQSLILALHVLVCFGSPTSFAALSSLICSTSAGILSALFAELQWVSMCAVTTDTRLLFNKAAIGGTAASRLSIRSTLRGVDFSYPAGSGFVAGRVLPAVRLEFARVRLFTRSSSAVVQFPNTSPAFPYPSGLLVKYKSIRTPDNPNPRPGANDPPIFSARPRVRVVGCPDTFAIDEYSPYWSFPCRPLWLWLPSLRPWLRLRRGLPLPGSFPEASVNTAMTVIGSLSGRWSTARSYPFRS